MAHLSSPASSLHQIRAALPIGSPRIGVAASSVRLGVATLSFVEAMLAASDDDSLSAADLRAWMRRAAVRLGTGEGKRSGKEIIARSLCLFDGNPENVKFEGRPMWMSYMDQASAVLKALDEGTETKG